MGQGTGPADESAGYFHRLFATAGRQQGKRPIPANYQHFHRLAMNWHRQTGIPRSSTGPAELQCRDTHPPAPLI